MQHSQNWASLLFLVVLMSILNRVTWVKQLAEVLLYAVASVGPLEGATIGGAIGGPVGAGVGFLAGAAIQGIKWFEPKFFDDPVKGTKNIVNKVGNGIKGVANAVSNGIGGIGKALGFG